ncbi:ABC transporter permease [Cellulomonas fimi]|uniref:Binding-protein-dependent transport systems inner membrane component n=1 Tax=Cellulomonas fimi (strain ATCC 484 / DSM 20113 / JCM 1341 / CCUG 24087 / LMG 16345 / NBRC 15513 / NCIMB 8980 / NCTC 7547 / NRS-133) TaxID=590998 RepID=F4H5Q8_CELFA|nr:ABC transporter permease subunit [Cellulomonas fimi]AEE45508.1 binding-protein-dependent transport systems inner membrane component [Cellulomonas fimi ATCC 484]NNH07266.1 ABC transporter permease subunit [Cellulomonas fimi]VEH29661.1 Putative osmoprotectant uptake system permease protein yehW [Cellulomonas fimi]
MDVLTDAFAWLNDPLNWTGRDGVLALTATHVLVSAQAVLLAAVVALPVGLWLGHRGRGATVGVVVANTTRALPTLALLTLLAASGMFGNPATVLACAVFAVPPLLSGAVTGLGDVDPHVRDAARGVGMSGARRLWTVEVPLAVPSLAAGLRTGAVQVLATVPLAALVGGTSLGTIVVTGFGTQRFGQALAGGLLVAALCLVAEGALALVQRLVTPAGLRSRERAARPAAGSPRRRRRPSPVATDAADRSNEPAAPR